MFLDEIYAIYPEVGISAGITTNIATYNYGYGAGGSDAIHGTVDVAPYNKWGNDYYNDSEQTDENLKNYTGKENDINEYGTYEGYINKSIDNDDSNDTDDYNDIRDEVSEFLDSL